MFVTIIVWLFYFGVSGTIFPPEVKLCHRSDPNFQKCLGKNLGLGLKTFGNGSKALGLPVLEPFFIKEIVIKNDPTKSITLEQIYRNVNFYGMTISDTQTNFKIDLDAKCGWVMDVKTPLVRMVGDYEMNGQILLFPLNAFGKCNITMYNMYNIHTMTCQKYTSNGKTFLRFTNYTMNIKLENIVYDFENVFPDNEQIAGEILKTMNENSLIIFNDMKSYFEAVFSSAHMALANRVFDKVPLDEIFLP